jgi:hypothetical protein
MDLQRLEPPAQNHHHPFEDETGQEMAEQGGPVDGDSGVGPCARRLGRTRCCNVIPFSDLGDPTRGTACSGRRSYEEEALGELQASSVTSESPVTSSGAGTATG